jgi:GTP cyclohydrolase I
MKRADEETIREILRFVGEDPMREGLLKTPARVLRAWKEWTVGYHQDVGKLLTCFKEGGEKYNEMVLLRDLPFYSLCEHHLAPFFGTAVIGYIPDKRVVGVSKLSRVLEVYARRLQIQERLTQQVADALMEHLHPIGVGVSLTARHLCMESRGICKQGQQMTTQVLRGSFLEPEVRAEFISFVHRSL